MVVVSPLSSSEEKLGGGALGRRKVHSADEGERVCARGLAGLLYVGMWEGPGWCFVQREGLGVNVLASGLEAWTDKICFRRGARFAPYQDSPSPPYRGQLLPIRPFFPFSKTLLLQTLPAADPVVLSTNFRGGSTLFKNTSHPAPQILALA
jgi:hypothetical protein